MSQAGQWQDEEPFGCHEYVKAQINTLLGMLAGLIARQRRWVDVFQTFPGLIIPFFSSSPTPFALKPQIPARVEPQLLFYPQQKQYTWHSQKNRGIWAGPSSFGKAKPSSRGRIKPVSRQLKHIEQGLNASPAKLVPGWQPNPNRVNAEQQHGFLQAPALPKYQLDGGRGLNPKSHSPLLSPLQCQIHPPSHAARRLLQHLCPSAVAKVRK